MNSLRWKIFVSVEARFSPTSAIVQNLLYFLPSGRISFDQYLHVDPSHFSYPNTVAHVRRLETNSLATHLDFFYREENMRMQDGPDHAGATPVARHHRIAPERLRRVAPRSHQAPHRARAPDPELLREALAAGG